MLEKIYIKDIASYDKSGIEVTLNKINYIFGSNGSGKTTISEFLRNSDNPKFSSCKLEWKSGSPDMDIFVYNRHFVNENFNVSKEIKGIFTLGKQSTDIIAQIDEKRKEIEKHQERISRLKFNITLKEGEIEELKKNFMNQCWELKKKFDKDFEEAFTGYRGDKKKFTEKFLFEARENMNPLYTFEELKQRTKTVFGNFDEKELKLIPKIKYDLSLEQQPIFKAKIIGKADLDIANLISKLNISDWVREGHKHIEKTDGLCPFCQQELPKNFKEKLDEYFDETYTDQIQQLESAIEKYKKETLGFFKNYQFLVTEEIPFINKEKIESLFDVLKSIYKENIQLLSNKTKEPSRSITLNSISNYIEQLYTEIDNVNSQISEIMRLMENKKEEKEKLIKDIWRFIVEENKYNYGNYIKSINQANKALEGMKRSKKAQEKYKNKFEREAIELEKQLISVLPSIDEINKLLKSYGFTNFYLTESEEKGFYKIVRDNGEDANETLSEGEKTFITFLYFYQLINGSNDQSKINTPRIIVIDDPISSLDSNVLFIVSSLINDLKKKIRNNDSKFKQLLIFTHNVYFHKEVSFNSGYGGSKKLSDETFWILRKINNVSHIKEYDENPIKNSYELLWRELRDNLDSITTPNIMRRILENYFKFFGNINTEQLIESFSGEDKIVCKTLLSWAHDGSHHVSDDLYVDSNPDLNQRFFNVFKKIFINSGHDAHFDMMMGNFIGSKNQNREAIEEKRVRIK